MTTFKEKVAHNNVYFIFRDEADFTGKDKSLSRLAIK